MPIRSPHDPVLVAACRTPVGTAGHAFAGLTVTELAAPVLAEAARRAAPLGLPVTEVVLGNCLGPGGNVGRIASLAAGLGTGVPGLTVDRQCGSGLEAVRLAAALVREAAARNDGGPAPLVLAGGAESASTAPWRFWPPAPGETPPRAGVGSLRRYERAPFAPAGFPDPEMGPAADRLARERGLNRERQDAYAARSHQRALAAMREPWYSDLVVPVGDVRADQRPRAMTAERLAALRPAFAGSSATGQPAAGQPAAGQPVTGRPAAGQPDAGPNAARNPAGTSPADDGTLAEQSASENSARADDAATATVTAGNASGISDGAAALALTTAAAARAARVPAVRVLAAAVTAADPALPGAGAGPAARAALAQAGVAADEIDVIEVVEAFAAVALAFADELGIDEHRLCPDGGAIAIGHPWGASGAIALAQVTHRLLAADPGTLGLAACAIGGGQGIAMVVQRCDEAER